MTRIPPPPAATHRGVEDVVDEAAFAATVDLLAGGSVVALTGAGLSTDSGIPDYRGPGAPVRTPMTIAEFKSGPVAQQRYWARSHLGWRRMGTAVPNAGHRAFAALENAGHLSELITQNVDGLHQQAGSRSVVDLHGRVDEVICLNCGQITPRLELHRRLDEGNPEFGADLDLVSAPDGDVEFDDTNDFRVAACVRCSGALKPNVVFFGDSVPKPVVQHCFSAVDDAKALLVAGSSLSVMSGLRFVRHAYRRGIPVVIINRGPTRGDGLATWRIDAGCSPALSRLAAELGA
ncbi:NAD-dependent protein deacetylase, SIR2 family [Nakamurella panacisegetis]|uniref:NAD-dependent protein deacetylase n=1 Tax=Nakamurella panacisegetis TaxID=1090615 RepID=A0A1H0QA74_9ACTN|nr:NAD-dependent protein deacetylase, SIR2 family [Nakamurella panacisegetis]